MKNLIIKSVSLSFTILMISFSLSAISAGNSHPDFTGSNYFAESNYFDEYFSYEEMNKSLDMQLRSEVSVKIFNSDNRLIASGNETEDKMKSLVKVADLLTEIDGTKYYRLSY